MWGGEGAKGAGGGDLRGGVGFGLSFFLSWDKEEIDLASDLIVHLIFRLARVATTLC